MNSLGIEPESLCFQARKERALSLRSFPSCSTFAHKVTKNVKSRPPTPGRGDKDLLFFARFPTQATISFSVRVQTPATICWKEIAFGRQTSSSTQGAVKSQCTTAFSTSRCENSRGRLNSRRHHMVDRRKHEFPSTSGHSTNCWILPSAPGHQNHRFLRVVGGVLVDPRLTMKEFRPNTSFRIISGVDQTT